MRARHPRRAHASDEQLALAAGRGNVAAFEALYDRYHLPLLSFARHMVGRPHDAEDVVQHTFLAADRTFRSGKVPKAVRAWLYTVARNRCVSVLRMRREDPGLVATREPSTENLADEVERREDLRNLLADLGTLPDDQRAALLLAELGDLPHPEVARVIGVRPAKVKALVFQAHETLMAVAHARAIPCQTIREELAVATGAALRRRHLRDHLARCAGCSEYAARVRAQRSALAVVLPVVPTVALREGVFSGLAGGVAAGVGGGASAGIGMLAAKSTAAKLLTIAAVGGAATAGGTVAVSSLDQARPERKAERVSSAPAAPRSAAPQGLEPAAALAGERQSSRDRRAGVSGSRRERGKSADRAAERRTARPAAQGRPGARGRAYGHRKQQERGKTPPGQARRSGGPAGQAKKGGGPPGQARAKASPAGKVTPQKPGPAKRDAGKPQTAGAAADAVKPQKPHAGNPRQPTPAAPVDAAPAEEAVPPGRMRKDAKAGSGGAQR